MANAMLRSRVPPGRQRRSVSEILELLELLEFLDFGDLAGAPPPAPLDGSGKPIRGR
jgi:hypothetical protein